MRNAINDMCANVKVSLEEKVGAVGVELVELSVHQVEMHDLILLNEDGNLFVRSRFGTIPQGYRLDLHHADKELLAKDFAMPSSPYFNIDVRFGNGGKLLRRIKTAGQVFWFQDYQCLPPVVID